MKFPKQGDEIDEHYLHHPNDEYSFTKKKISVKSIWKQKYTQICIGREIHQKIDI